MEQTSPYLLRLNCCAQCYCAWAEASTGPTPEGAISGIGVLAELLSAAIALPPPRAFDPDAPDPEALASGANRETLYRCFGTIPFQYYTGVLDPFELSAVQTGVGDILDDLADIYADLEQGLALFQAGYYVAAHHHYFQSFYSHWGKHATDAIRVLFLSIRDSQVARSWTLS